MHTKQNSSAVPEGDLSQNHAVFITLDLPLITDFHGKDVGSHDNTISFHNNTYLKLQNDKKTIK